MKRGLLSLVSVAMLSASMAMGMREEARIKKAPCVNRNWKEDQSKEDKLSRLELALMKRARKNRIKKRNIKKSRIGRGL